MSNPFERLSPADRWADQQERDRLIAETAAIVAWQTYRYESGTDADRRAMRIGWGLLPSIASVCSLWQMCTHPHEHGAWSVSGIILTALCGLLGAWLVFVKPIPRDAATEAPAAARYPDDETFEADWRGYFNN